MDLSTVKPWAGATRAWAARWITAAGGRDELPAFGSRAWHRLPDGNPTKAAALVVAALAWHTSVVNIERDLAEELEARRRADDKLADEQWAAATNRVVHIATARRRAVHEHRPGPAA